MRWDPETPGQQGANGRILGGQTDPFKNVLEPPPSHTVTLCLDGIGLSPPVDTLAGDASQESGVVCMTYHTQRGQAAPVLTTQRPAGRRRSLPSCGVKDHRASCCSSRCPGSAWYWAGSRGEGLADVDSRGSVMHPPVCTWRDLPFWCQRTPILGCFRLPGDPGDPRGLANDPLVSAHPQSPPRLVCLPVPSLSGL